MRDKATGSVEAIERAVQVLDSFSVEQPELGVAEVARHLGMKRSTVHRALVSLEAGGLLRQDPTTQKYALGPKVLSLAKVFQSHFSLPAVALPAMRALRDRCNETVALHVLEEGRRSCIMQVESRHDLRRIYQNLGSSLPLHAGSPSRVLMAYLSEDEARALLEAEGLERYTPITITEIEQYMVEMREARRLGYAMSFGEHSPGINSICVAILDSRGTAVAAVNISGPQVRLSEARMLEYLPFLRETTRSISRQLGFRTPGPGPNRVI